MNKTLKKLSAFFKRVFNCTCNKSKNRHRRNKSNKSGKSKKMKGGWDSKKLLPVIDHPDLVHPYYNAQL